MRLTAVVPAFIFCCVTIFGNGSAHAQSVSLYCPRPSQAGGDMIIKVDYANNSISYSDQDQATPIVSSAVISDINISWTQTELWSFSGSAGHLVKYSLNRISGEIQYNYTDTDGMQKTGSRKCAKPTPQF